MATHADTQASAHKYACAHLSTHANRCCIHLNTTIVAMMIATANLVITLGTTRLITIIPL